MSTYSVGPSLHDSSESTLSGVCPGCLHICFRLPPTTLIDVKLPKQCVDFDEFSPPFWCFTVLFTYNRYEVLHQLNKAPDSLKRKMDTDFYTLTLFTHRSTVNH